MPFLLAKAVALSPDSRNSRSASRASASVQRFARPLLAFSPCSDIAPRSQSRQRARCQAYAGRRWVTPQVKELTADVASMESAKGHTFTLPPRVWLVGRIAKLHELLAHRTEQSALAL